MTQLAGRCESTYTPMSLNPVTMQCERTDLDELGRHMGNHHAYVQELGGFTRLWTWSEGGAMGTTKEAEPCILCHTPHNSEKYADVTPETDTRVCFMCREWARRVEQYNSDYNKTITKGGRKDSVLLRPHKDNAYARHDSLYCWSFTVTGGFGDLPHMVEMDDGRKFGWASKLWYSGVIPWWLDDQFPPNAKVIR